MLQRRETTAVSSRSASSTIGQPLPQHQVHCSIHNGQILITAGGMRRYSNPPDLLEQLRKATVILSDVSQDEGAGARVTIEGVIRSRRLRDRFSPEDLQTMIDLYRSGTTARRVAEEFGVSLRSVTRLLDKHGVHRRSGCLAGGPTTG
jgi:hypothetical protein